MTQPSGRAVRAVRVALALAWMAAAWLGMTAAHAFQVRPVRVELSARAPTAQLLVSNPGPHPVLLQAQALHWAQDERGERLEPDADLIVNPPIFELAPGAQQLVRVGLRRPLPAGRQRTWRLWLSQVALPADGAAGGVQMLVRVSLPVFGEGDGLGGPEPAWRLEPGGRALVLNNGGARHLHVRTLRLVDEAQAPLTLGPCYALAGGRCRWVLPAAWVGRALSVDADTDVGPWRGRVDAVHAD